MPQLIEIRPWIRRGASVATWLAIGVIVLLSWMPRGVVPRTGAPGALEHVLAYAVTGALASMAGRPGQVRWFGLAFMTLAAVLEIGQLWIPGRVSQFSDFAAGSAGAVVGLAFAAWTCGVEARSPDLSPHADSDFVSRVLLFGLVVAGVLVTPVWVIFLVWMVGSGLAWLLR